MIKANDEDACLVIIEGTGYPTIHTKWANLSFVIALFQASETQNYKYSTFPLLFVSPPPPPATVFKIFQQTWDARVHPFIQADLMITVGEGEMGIAVSYTHLTLPTRRTV